MKPVVRTLHSFITELRSKSPEKVLISDKNARLTPVDILRQVSSAAVDLLRRGIKPGDPVALRTRRDQKTAVAILALQAVGALAVLVDPRQDPGAFAAEQGIPVKLALDPEALDFSRTDAQPELPDVDPRDPGFLIFTSGSTGKPKAVMVSQYNLVNNLIDSQPLGYYTEDDIALGALPMDHVFGLVLLAGMCVLGYRICFPEKTDVTGILQTIQESRITRMNGVPSLYLAMAEQAKEYDLSSLRAGFIGGGPCTAEQFALIEQALAMTLIPVYGMSECIGISCGNWQDPQEKRCCGVGPFYSMNTGRILREDGTEAGPGEVGEVCVTGPARMVGYYPDPMPAEELLHTGDLGYLDEDGILHLTGRKKDIIIRNGVNLSPRRIEEALLAIPGVSDAAVVGIPHPIQGEVPCAMVVSNRTAQELTALLVLPKNEIPARILVADHLPRTGSGKADKQKIREELMAWKA